VTAGQVFHHQIAIRYGEVDHQGVVFNAHYLAYVDDVMDRWMRQLDADFESLGWDFMVRHAEVDWLGGAGIGDILDFEAQVIRWGNTSFVVRHRGRVVGEDRLVFQADLTYVGVSPAGHEPLAAPAVVRRHLGGPAGDAP
jgi:acyl-CoA thioester hydrolase